MRSIWVPALLAVLLSGCTTLPNGRGWGQDATLFPGFKKIGHAALNSLRDPDVWIPVVGTAVFSIDDWDENVSIWATDHAPIFGTPENAGTASDYLKASLIVAAGTTALLTPSGEDPKTWTMSKFKGLTVETAAFFSTSRLTNDIKRWSGRHRPNGDEGSFPSMHSSQAHVSSKLAIRNLESLPLSERARTYYATGFRTLAAMTAWARIEKNKHYPSDVLVGAALGNFLGGFIQEAFMGLEDEEYLKLTFIPTEDGPIYLLRIKL
ncbi:MAG TPA: phosphatase PAP2 family protein [Nitrospiria bacterium]